MATPTSPWLHEEGLTFLNHGSFGSTPRPVLELQAALRAALEGDPVRFLRDEYQGRLDAARAALAPRLGADPLGLAFVPNPTFGVNSILASLELAPGDEIVVTSHGYNACNNAARRWADRAGAAVVVADVPFPLHDPAEVTGAIVGVMSARTRLVVADHVTSPTGLVLPIDDIVREARRRGALTLVDGAHAPGMLQVDVSRLGADYYVGAFHKWVCAPKGASFLYTAEDRRATTRPVVTSHGANAPLDGGSRYHVEFDWTGTHDPTPILCAPRAYEFLDTLHPEGLSGVMRDNRALALRARDLLCDALGVPAPCPDSMIGSLAAVPLPDSTSAGAFDPLQTALRSRHAIQVPIVPFPAPPRRLVRVAAQVYNSVEQYERLARALDEELSAGSQASP